MGEDRFVSQKRERPNILLKAAKFNFHDGDPDLGKSLITLDLAARVTTGQPMPDGSPGITGNVILIAPEDDAADTIKPRILAAGGDPSRIRLLTMLDARDPRTDEPRLSPFTLPTHLPTLISSVQHFQAILVIIDPLIAVLDSKVSASNDQQMRHVLTWLDRLARHDQCAILLVRHLTKGSSSNPLYRGSGSVGIIASARSSLLVVRDPSDEQKRILTVTKNNLSTKAPDLTYHITSHPSGYPTIHWLGTSYVPLPTLLKNTSALSATRQAILNVLRDSAVPLGPKDIAELTGQKYEQVKVVLRRMFNAQEILCLTYGLYTVHGHPSLNTPPPQEQATPETLETPVTLEPMSDLASNVSDIPTTPTTPVTLVTPATLEPVSDLNSNVSDTPETLGTPDTVNSLDSNVSDIPATSVTLVTLESTSDFAPNVSDIPATSVTLVTLKPLSDLNSNLPDTPTTSTTLDTVNNFDSNVSETLETLETVEAPGQTPSTPPIDLETIIKKIRATFYCSHDIHYLHWLISTQKIGCPICDSWLVRDTVFNPSTLALYKTLNQYPPHENE